jgi:hypothetical protein
MTLLSTTTMTGSSVTVSSISGAYLDLRIEIRNYKPATDNSYLLIRLNNDATANRHRQLYMGTNAITAVAFNDSSSLVMGYNDNSIATGLATIDIPDYANTVTWKQAISFNVSVATNGTDLHVMNTHTLYNQTAAISSLNFFPSSGNFTSGEILVYGVK